MPKSEIFGTPLSSCKNRHQYETPRGKLFWCQSEMSKCQSLTSTSDTYQDVSRGQVAVHNVVRVQVREAQCNALDECALFRGAECLFVHDAVETAAVAELEHNARHVRVDAHAVRQHHIRVRRHLPTTRSEYDSNVKVWHLTRVKRHHVTRTSRN